MQEQLGRERCSRGRRVVRHVARARDQLLGVAGGIEERAHAVVPEPLYHRVRDLTGADDPLRVERQLVNGEESERDRGVVLEKS